MVFLATVAAVLLIGLVLAMYGAGIYNGLVMLKNNIDKSWANIDVLLKQRHDELPKLVEACKAYMSHEQGTLERVIKARQNIVSAQGPAAVGRAEGELQGALRQLFALSENYPQLRAQDSFAQLQKRISDLESQIADRREFYNDSTNTYNIRIDSIPDLFVARMLAYQKRELFQVAPSDREDVPLHFK
jgi:LemA protein